MIAFQRTVLSNGLRVIINRDPLSPMCTVNMLYGVGSRDERQDKTGMAHFLEHLMFSGSRNVADFDLEVESIGGYNNAFTGADFTNYYMSLPAQNLETALWLEADRMKDLELTESDIERERSVVLEEYNETVLNPPYGMTWHHLCEMVYRSYPYRWPTIGLAPSHIESFTLADVQQFYREFYSPQNAILSISGGVQVDSALELVNKYFGHLNSSEVGLGREYPEEHPASAKRQFDSPRPTPSDTVFMAFLMPDRMHRDYYAADLISDILCGSESSRLYQRLVKTESIFNDIDAYISGSHGPGMFVITGQISSGVSHQAAEAAIWRELELIKSDISADECLRQIRLYESREHFQRIKNSHRALELAYYDYLGDVNGINSVLAKYQSLTNEQLHLVASDLFISENCSILRYHKK